MDIFLAAEILKVEKGVFPHRPDLKITQKNPDLYVALVSRGAAVTCLEVL